MEPVMKKLIAVVTLPLLLTACQSTGDENNMAKTISVQDLQHHNWELTQIDGKTVITPDSMQAPRLEIGEKMTANGNAGCNNFFGQGELDGNNFRILQMGMTMKMCVNDVMGTEMVLSQTLPEWNKMVLTKETMTLTSENHTLTFKLSDWK
ncbi:META domain-containing protein [Vibrio sp. DW001]|uniref:META domain-containing protein n=1 Tax=Vibrio sp. DW001 TaxID=2912315 RepID=UPI0023AF7273|nr:META domain-containing protein [Vibrio sp. DW001]WED28353.1 META domain-containing protein [Vibrio sp. DW001]